MSFLRLGVVTLICTSETFELMLNLNMSFFICNQLKQFSIKMIGLLFANLVD